MSAQPGSLVSYREREWLVLPSDDPNLVLLRPIGGSSREVCGVVKSVSDLIAYTLPYERISPTTFPLPDGSSAQDHTAVQLLQQAARLLISDDVGVGKTIAAVLIAREMPDRCSPPGRGLRGRTNWVTGEK